MKKEELYTLIEKVRSATLHDFQGSEICDYPLSTASVSPSENYFFEAAYFSKPIADGITFGNFYFTKITIFDYKTKEIVGEYLTNNYAGYDFKTQKSVTIHTWLVADGKEYLFLPEAKLGFSVFDLQEKKLFSHIEEHAQFEIMEFHPSSDGLFMAVVLYGNHPRYKVVVYDISMPTVLPYKEVFSKNIPDDAYIEKVECNFGHVKIHYFENHRFSNPFLKVQIRETNNDITDHLRCHFSDIHGKAFTCFEKNQAMFGFVVDETVALPLDSLVNISIIGFRTENGRKIYKIGGGISYNCTPEMEFIEVFEEQIEF